MIEQEILEVLDRIEETNARLDQTIARLGALEGRVNSLELRITEGFDTLTAAIDRLGQRELGSELRSAIEILSQVTHDVRSLLRPDAQA